MPPATQAPVPASNTSTKAPAIGDTPSVAVTRPVMRPVSKTEAGALALLLAPFGSVYVVVTVAVLSMEPVAVVATVSVTVLLAPATRAPRAQLTVPGSPTGGVTHTPWGTLIAAKAVPAGGGGGGGGAAVWGGGRGGGGGGGWAGGGRARRAGASPAGATPPTAPAG